MMRKDAGFGVLFYAGKGKYRLYEIKFIKWCTIGAVVVL